MAFFKKKAQVPLAALVPLNEELDHMEDVFSKKKTTKPDMYWFATHVQLNKEMFADKEKEFSRTRTKIKFSERIKRFLKRKN